MLSCNLPNSPKKPFNQTASLQACEAAMYYAFVVDKATMFCSFDIQLIAPPARVKTYLEVDIILSKSPAKSESTYPQKNSLLLL